MSNRFIDFLFTPAAVFAFTVVLIACIAALWKKRKVWSIGTKIVVCLIAVACVLYLALVVTAVIGFGEAPPPAAPAMPG